MPFYKITVWDRYGRKFQGLRYHPEADIDVFYQKVEIKCISTIRDFKALYSHALEV